MYLKFDHCRPIYFITLIYNVEKQFNFIHQHHYICFNFVNLVNIVVHLYILFSIFYVPQTKGVGDEHVVTTLSVFLSASTCWVHYNYKVIENSTYSVCFLGILNCLVGYRQLNSRIPQEIPSLPRNYKWGFFYFHFLFSFWIKVRAPVHCGSKCLLVGISVCHTIVQRITAWKII